MTTTLYPTLGPVLEKALADGDWVTLLEEFIPLLEDKSAYRRLRTLYDNNPQLAKAIVLIISTNVKALKEDIGLPEFLEVRVQMDLFNLTLLIIGLVDKALEKEGVLVGENKEE